MEVDRRRLFDDEADEGPDVDGPVTRYVFSDVTYRNLAFLHRLRGAGIAYDSDWSSGDEYTAGTDSCRFSPEGEVIEKAIYDEARNPDLQRLLTFIDQPAQLRQAILDHQEQISVPNLADANEEHGKRYQVLQLLLISPKPNPK